MFTVRRAHTIRNFVNLYESIRNKSTNTNFVKNLKHLKKLVNSCNSSSSFSSSNLSLDLQKETELFMLIYPDVVRDLTQFNDCVLPQPGLRDAEKHFEKVLHYNVPNGKKIRGLTIVAAYKDLMIDESLTPEKVRQAYLLGWCVEILQTAIHMSDDMIDCSEIRCGKPCWYKVDDVKSLATNDLLMIESGCYHLLKRYFGHLPCYTRMVELMHESTLDTFIGKSLDSQMSNNAAVPQFTMKKYRSIAGCKTSHFAFYTPIALPMMLAGYNDEKVYDDIKAISFEIGHFYQVQNDFLDCFGESGVLQKPGTNIKNGKFTWLAAQTMELGNDEQREIMKKCYGINDPECIKNVKKVYDDLDLPEIYKGFKEKTYDNTKEQIEKSLYSDKRLQNVMMNSLNRVFNRA